MIYEPDRLRGNVKNKKKKPYTVTEFIIRRTPIFGTKNGDLEITETIIEPTMLTHKFQSR